MILFPKCLFIFCKRENPELEYYGRVFCNDTKQYVYAEIKKCRHCFKIISRPMEKEEIRQFNRKEGYEFWKLRG